MPRPNLDAIDNRPPQAVVRLPMNTAGRDFVVGDIHGTFNLVWKAMKSVSFDPRRDRLLSVGDLVDRGPGSHRVLEFLSQPYVHAIRGNHDDDFCGVPLESLPFLGRANFNGLAWVLDTNPEKLLAIGQRLRQLPYVIEVETPRGLVGLVHADVPAGMSWKLFTDRLRAGDAEVVKCALSSRRRVEERVTTGVEGVGRVFVGHTICEDGPRRLGNVYCVDTGAFLSLREQPEEAERGSLTIASLTCRSDYLAGRPVQDTAPALRVCHEEDIERTLSAPFTLPRVAERARS
jgi:serine/threonine protein phosphatase 1